MRGLLDFYRALLMTIAEGNELLELPKKGFLRVVNQRARQLLTQETDLSAYLQRAPARLTV
jgi:hypothetical protein